MHHIKFITKTLKPVITTHACHPSPGEAEIQKSLQIQGHRELQSGVLSQSICAYKHQTGHDRAEFIMQNV